MSGLKTWRTIPILPTELHVVILSRGADYFTKPTAIVSTNEKNHLPKLEAFHLSDLYTGTKRLSAVVV